MKSQRFLVKEKEIIISSPTQDWLQYHCVDKSSNGKMAIKVGVNKLPTKTGCHYETSELQLRNPAQSTVKILEPGSDRGLKIIQDLDSLDGLLEAQLPKELNLTALKMDLTRYSSDIISVDKEVDRIAAQVDTLDSIRTMSEFSPTSLDLTRPFHTSNWVAFMFWILIVMALILLWTAIRRIKWYKNVAKPGCLAFFRMLAAIVCKLATCKKENSNLKKAYSSMWEVYDPNSKVSMQNSQVEQLELLAPTHNHKMLHTPNVSAPSRPKSTEQSWKTIQAVYGNWQMKGVHQSSPIYYNPRSGVVTTLDGKIMENVTKPTREDIDYFYQIVKNSKIPPTVVENGVIKHKTYSNLYYNTGLKVWMNEENQSSLPGLNPPQNYPLYIPHREENEEQIEAM